MPQELTLEYNMKNWREATRGWSFIMYSIEGYEKMPSTLYIQDSSSPNGLYSKTDSERNLSKASQKRAIPIGS
ncbi:MAG: hypothetical protein HQ551_12375 [Desulfobacteraceae bacterium]|nr:hypothetical protein [Desulfobacteraceae bacterium]